MNREQRQRLNQLTAEQQAWQEGQQAYASSVPYTYGLGQVDWLAQMGQSFLVKTGASPQVAEETVKWAEFFNGMKL